MIEPAAVTCTRFELRLGLVGKYRGSEERIRERCQWAPLLSKI